MGIHEFGFCYAVRISLFSIFFATASVGNATSLVHLRRGLFISTLFCLSRFATNHDYLPPPQNRVPFLGDALTRNQNHITRMPQCRPTTKATNPLNNRTTALPHYPTCLLEPSRFGSHAQPPYVVPKKNEPGAALDQIHFHRNSPMREPCSTCIALSERGRNILAKAFTSDRIKASVKP